MPGSPKQQRYFGAVLGRRRAGETEQGDPTEMTDAEVADFARKPPKRHGKRGKRTLRKESRR